MFKKKPIEKEDIKLSEVRPEMPEYLPEAEAQAPDVAINPAPEPLAPVSVEISVLPETEDTRPLYRGQVLMIALDAGGNEVPPAFVTTEKAAVKYYSDPEKFRIKKKGN